MFWTVWNDYQSLLLSMEYEFRSSLGRVLLTTFTTGPRVCGYGGGPQSQEDDMTRKLNLKVFGVLFGLLLAATTVHAQAYLTQSVDTTSLNNAVYGTLNGTAGPFPFNNLGVQATDSLGLQWPPPRVAPQPLFFQLLLPGTPWQSIQPSIMLTIPCGLGAHRQ